MSAALSVLDISTALSCRRVSPGLSSGVPGQKTGRNPLSLMGFAFPTLIILICENLMGGHYQTIIMLQARTDIISGTGGNQKAKMIQLSPAVRFQFLSLSS